MPTVIGLDLSLTSTGIACDGERKTLSSKRLAEDRLIDLRQLVLEEVVTRNEPIVVMEGYSFASRNSHAHSLGELGGVVKVGFREAGVPFVVVPPTVRAKFATGNGHASKVQVVSAVSARTGIVFPNDDVVDAEVLAEMGRIHYLGSAMVDWPKAQLQVLESVQWV